MKLRNKRTGLVGELHYEPDKEYHFTVATEDPADMTIHKTLAELNDEWEDYKPTEPLIKDEKARAIFKMWADNFKDAMLDGTFTFYVDREYYSFMANLKPTGESQFEDVAAIDLSFDCGDLEDGKTYTIAELCGEEEE